ATRTRLRPDGSTAAATASWRILSSPKTVVSSLGRGCRWRSDHAEPRRGDRGGLQFAQGEFTSPKRSISEPTHARTNTIVHRRCVCPPIPAFVVDCRENL